MKTKLTFKHKCAAYVLNKDADFNCSQKKIGKLLGVSQSSISNAIKEMEYLKTIRSLENEDTVKKFV